MITRIEKLREKKFFSTKDVAEAFGIKLDSAKVLCYRYVKNNIFLRLKKDFYVLRHNWEIYSRQDFFKLANFLQVPSYISLVSALSEYEVTTQIPRNYYESITLKRSIKFSVKGVAFNYYKTQEKYYFGLEKRNGIFIATKEKAFLDAVYLYSFGKYKIDFHALNLDILDKDKIREMAKIFPMKTQRTIQKICRI
ncbi:MAG: hypothetical protein AB7E08_00740 [Candidatus Omnitrophota bacterium]